MDRARKAVIDIFKKECLKVTTEANSTSVDFLDVVLDLKNDITKPVWTTLTKNFHNTRLS